MLLMPWVSIQYWKILFVKQSEKVKSLEIAINKLTVNYDKLRQDFQGGNSMRDLECRLLRILDDIGVKRQAWCWYSYRPHPTPPAWHNHMVGSHGRSRLTTIVTLLFCVLPLTTNSNAFNTFSGQRPLYYVMPTGAWFVYVIRYSYLRV